jgi:hypothetical protein
MHGNSPGSGTYAIDNYRQSVGDGAAAVILAGRGQTLKSGDHKSAGELCVEVLVRRGNDNTTSVSSTAVQDVANKAVDALRRGDAHHKAQADHSGGNTCIAVIAASTS